MNERQHRQCHTEKPLIHLFSFRSPSFVRLWTLTATETRRTSIYDMWHHPIHGLDFHWISSYVKSISWQGVYQCGCWCFSGLVQYQSPSCVLPLLNSANPVIDEVQLWCTLLFSCQNEDLSHNICVASYQYILLAPEVLSGGPYNHAADWWSLGILLFSLVTGEVMAHKPSVDWL